MSQACIVGAYNTKFGNFVRKNKETGELTDTMSIYDLTLEAGRGALRDAGIPAADIDGVWVGSCAPGMFANQEHLAAFAAEIDPAGLRFKPMTRCEAACASGSVALYDAVYAIEAGRARFALVVGVEKMNLLGTSEVTHALATCSFWPEEGAKAMTFPGLFAEYAKGYAARYGLSPEELARMLAAISALSYRNGIDNPLAHFGKGGPSDRLGLMTAEAILALGAEKNPVIAAPLRLHDCSLVTDGAAAVVLARSEDARKSGMKAAEIAGIGHVNERLALADRTNMHELIAGKEAVRRAFAEAGIAIGDVDLAEVHDCFSINQLLSTEALGLSKDGRAGFDYLEGRFDRDDRCPVNLSGGLKAKGHPVGATGVSMHALIYKQLVGEPIGALRSRGAPEIGVSFNVGGSAVTNCATVLRRVG
ncbi:MAG TPA: beta-ketoacyl synthase N-terminal-like domain-containing protein [Rectinemataceae bacterium]|nr:beta-ketoacyl synthase N-terminal-like domain-containing protein [Rectinemataceae bacterium]